MTPEREKLIRRHWRQAARTWSSTSDYIRVPIERSMSESVGPLDAPIPVDFSIDVLEFRREPCTLEDGRFGEQVVCEGLVVARWPR